MDYQSKLNSDVLQFPEEFLSLYHHPIYGDLSDEQKWKLSLLETVNFFSANIFGEQHLISHMEKKSTAINLSVKTPSPANMRSILFMKKIPTPLCWLDIACATTMV